MSIATTHFELIAAKAKIMAERNGRWYWGEVRETCNDIRKSLSAIEDEIRNHEAGDR